MVSETNFSSIVNEDVIICILLRAKLATLVFAGNWISRGMCGRSYCDQEEVVEKARNWDALDSGRT